MTLALASNMAAEWQYHCLKMVATNTVEFDFRGQAAVTGKGYVLEKYEEVDWSTMMVFVQTNVSAKTINVGLMYAENSNGGNASGFLAGVSLATAGWVRPTWTVTQSTYQAYISASTIGALFQKGQDGAATSYYGAVPIYQNYLGGGTQKTLTYTTSSGDTTSVSYLWFRTRRLPDLTNFLVK